MTITRTYKDTDITKAGYDMLGNMFSGMLEAHETLSPGVISVFKRAGVTFSDATAYELVNGTKEGMTEYLNTLKEEEIRIKPNFERMGVSSGETYSRAYLDELNKKGPILVNKTAELGKDTISATSKAMLEQGNEISDVGTKILDNAVKNMSDEAGITGQKKGFWSMGKGFLDTMNKGMNDNKSAATDTMKELTNEMQTVADKNQISFKFNSNVDSSFNSILTKEEKFADNWRVGINTLLSNTKTTFGGIALNSLTNFVFSAMKRISIPKFAEGGYPTSGDLFFANENGRAEYITSLGNKTAVANQDQMVSALTNAILQGMSSVQPQQGITQVYIGNEKVYEGYGTYQNRQADRYGTTTIKI